MTANVIDLDSRRPAAPTPPVVCCAFDGFAGVIREVADLTRQLDGQLLTDATQVTAKLDRWHERLTVALAMATEQEAETH